MPLGSGCFLLALQIAGTTAPDCPFLMSLHLLLVLGEDRLLPLQGGPRLFKPLLRGGLYISGTTSSGQGLLEGYWLVFV